MRGRRQGKTAAFKTTCAALHRCLGTAQPAERLLLPTRHLGSCPPLAPATVWALAGWPVACCLTTSLSLSIRQAEDCAARSLCCFNHLAVPPPPPPVRAYVHTCACRAPPVAPCHPRQQKTEHVSMKAEPRSPPSALHAPITTLLHTPTSDPTRLAQATATGLPVCSTETAMTMASVEAHAQHAGRQHGRNSGLLPPGV